jgi:hypothetical protein
MTAKQNNSISKSGTLKLNRSLHFIIASGIATTDSNAMDT